MGGYWNGKSHGLVRRWDIDGRETSAIGYDNQRAHGIYLNYFYKNGQFNGSRHLNKFQGRRAPRADLLERRR
jgi:antitoxin component YwqK of YwqJK toxin-antitoxin module